MKLVLPGDAESANVTIIVLACTVGAFAVVIAAIAQHIGDVFTGWMPIDLAPDPLALVALGCLAGSVLLEVIGKHGRAIALLIIPSAIFAVLTVESISGWKMLRWQDLTGSSQPTLLEPSVATPSADLVLAILATAIALQSGRRWRMLSVLASSVLLALATMSFVMIASNLMKPDAVSRYVLMSPAAAITSMLLATAILALRRESGWPSLLIAPDRSGSILRIAFPVVLTIPVIALYVELVLDNSRLVSRDMAEVLTACLNVAAFAGILLWAVGGVSRSKAQLATTSQALDMAPIVITDLKGTIEYWSSGCERLYGWSRAEAIGQSKYRLLGSSDNAIPVQVPRLAKTSDMTDRVLTEQRRDDRPISVIEEARLVDVPGQAPKLVLSMTDITERQTVLKALQESEARLELALDAHSLSVFEWERASNRVTWTVNKGPVFGIPPNQLQDIDDWKALIEPEDQERMQRALERAEANHAPRFNFVYRLNTPTGEQRTIEGSARCIYSDDGKLVGSVGLSMDVTERVQADRALLARGEQFRSVLEHVPSSMLIINDAGTVLSFSKSAEILFGYSAEEVVGHHVSILTKESDDDDDQADIFNEELAKTASGMRRLSARHRDGREIPVEAWVGEFRTYDSRLFTIFLNDVSRSIENEKRLYALGQELAHAWRVNTMGEITAGIAHELNQPLSAIVNFLAAAKRLVPKDGPKAEIARDALEGASSQALRAGQIIRRMRLFASKGEIDKRPLNLAEVIEEATELMRFGDMDRITVSNDLQANALVFGDRIQIQQVFINLLRNAVEALNSVPQRNHQIVISTRECDRGMIEVEVSDTGPGLPDSRLSQAFSPFLTAKEAGMGIGLSVCKRIVEAHGGKMSAENRREGGAVVRFTLPVVQEEELA